MSKSQSKLKQPQFKPLTITEPFQLNAVFEIPKEYDNDEKHLFNLMRLKNAFTNLGEVMWFNLDAGEEKDIMFGKVADLYEEMIALATKNK